MRFSIQVDEAQRLSQVKFRAAGCNVLIAVASMLTEQVTGLTTAEAATFGSEATSCAALARDALLDAICEYSDAARDDWAGDEALICTCFFVSERTIENEVAANGLTTVAEVTRVCNAGGGCGSCHQLIQEILEANDLPR